MSSLPVPVSPVISTEMSVAATFSTLRNTSCIGGLVPMISPNRICSRRLASRWLSTLNSSSKRALLTMSEAWAANTVSAFRVSS